MLHPFWITKINKCEIGISPCPSGGLDLETELNSLFLGNQLSLISLLVEEEVIALKLHNEGLISTKIGIDFRAFPIVDSSIPGASNFIGFIEELYVQTKEVNRMLIHCRAGIGRSSLIALGLMTKHGLNLKESIELASKVRGIDVPQSFSQRKLLSYYATTLGDK